jgi:hypothetical protein
MIWRPVYSVYRDQFTQNVKTFPLISLGASYFLPRRVSDRWPRDRWRECVHWHGVLDQAIHRERYTKSDTSDIPRPPALPPGSCMRPRGSNCDRSTVMPCSRLKGSTLEVRTHLTGAWRRESSGAEGTREGAEVREDPRVSEGGKGGGRAEREGARRGSRPRSGRRRAGLHSTSNETNDRGVNARVQRSPGTSSGEGAWPREGKHPEQIPLQRLTRVSPISASQCDNLKLAVSYMCGGEVEGDGNQRR